MPKKGFYKIKLRVLVQENYFITNILKKKIKKINLLFKKNYTTL